MQAITSFILASVLFASASFTVVHASDINKSFKVKAGGTLTVDSDSGSIDIESHDNNTVVVEVQRQDSDDDSFKVSFSSNGRDVKIDGDREQSFFGWSSRVRFLIKVPNSYNVDLNTGGGSIQIEDLIGDVEARTSGGSIRLGKIIGDVDIRTSGGSIKVEEVTGNIHGHTSGGSIRATIAKQPTEDCRLTTSGGSITAYLASDIKIDLKASTSGGRVRSELPVTGSLDKRSIKGEINGGGPELFLRTSGGSVNIKNI